MLSTHTNTGKVGKIFAWGMLCAYFQGDGENDGYAYVHPNVTFRRFLAPSLSNTFDMIIVHRVLVELASKESRNDLVRDLWNRTTE